MKKRTVLKMCDVSIIIVNYNTKDLLCDCVDSIICHCTGVSYEIIVVDNASDDGSVQLVKNRYQTDVTVIESESNLGFGRANNLGAKFAKGKYLFLLNSDTVLLNDAIAYFFHYAEQAEKKNIFGAYLLNQNKEIIHSYSDFQDKAHIYIRMAYLYFPFLLSLRYRLKKTNAAETPVDKTVDFITGADMFMEKALYDQLNGFDPHFFMYCEDEDLCLRARAMGIGCKVITEPQIIHLEGKSSKISKTKREIQMCSYRYFMRKHFNKELCRNN